MSTFVCPPERRSGLEAVKNAVGIQHSYLDSWIYLFYENKKFDVKETIAKLNRRDHMEKTVFANYTMTPSLQQSMRAGIVQYIGRDKSGRPVLYFNTVRDSPKADQRPERQANMDMFLSWSVRVDPINPTSTVTWLINQKDASLMRNTDLIFQKDMALRISKFFPGVVAKMYICNMGSALTFVMKPLLKQLPSAISDCIFLYSAGDIRRGKLLEVIDADVLPIAMGGNNDCDNSENYEKFATTIEKYFSSCVSALKGGTSIKEMEMMDAFPVDATGKPRAGSSLPSATNAQIQSEGNTPDGHSRARRIAQAGEETLDEAAANSITLSTPAKIVVDRNETDIMFMSSTVRPGRTGNSAATHAHGPGAQPSGAGVAEVADSSLVEPVAASPTSAFVGHYMGGVPLSAAGDQMTFFCSLSPSDVSSLQGEQLDEHGLPMLRLDALPFFSFSENIPSLQLSQNDVCVLQRNWTQFLCHCVDLLPVTLDVMTALRDGSLETDQILQLHESLSLIRRVTHHAFDIFPQTTQPLHYPVYRWLTAGLYRSHHVQENDVVDKISLDCTSPDNLLLSVQGTALEYVDECERLLEVDRVKDRILRRLVLSWPANVTCESLLKSCKVKIADFWRQLIPLFHKYIESKVAIAIAEFIAHYGLLANGGKIDKEAEWYCSLFNGLVQYRELHRRSWLFYVFPPLCSGAAMNVAAPSLKQMLEAHGSRTTIDSAVQFIVLIERSLLSTREQLGPSSVTSPTVHNMVENYLEETGSKIYVPYEKQVSGVSPRAMQTAEKEAARKALEAAEQPMKELLFYSAITFVLEEGLDGKGRPQPVTREALLFGVSQARRRCLNLVESRRVSRRVAVSMAKIAYEIQGTFCTDGPVSLGVYGSKDATGRTLPAARPDGYAVGIILLLVESLVNYHQQMFSPANESFALSLDSGGFQGGCGSPGLSSFGAQAEVPSSPLVAAGKGENSGGDGDDDDEMHSACSAEALNIDEFLATLSAADGAAGLLVSSKRALMRQSA